MTAVNVTEEMTLTKPNRAKGSMPWTAKIYDKKIACRCWLWIGDGCIVCLL